VSLVVFFHKIRTIMINLVAVLSNAVISDPSCLNIHD